MADQQDWRINLLIQHPSINEPPVMREARVLRTLRAILEVNSNELRSTELGKFHKVINTRLISIMDEVRDAEPQS